MPRGTLCLAVLLVAVGFAVPEAVVVGTRHPSTRIEVEDNNSAAVATPLNSTGPYGVGVGGIGSPGDVDYWSFQAAASAYVSILCDTGGAQAAGATSRRVTLELIGWTGETLERDTGDGTGNGGDATIETGDAAAIAFRLLPEGGTFYVRVSGLTATDVVAPYRLFVAVTPFVHGPEIEPNDNPSSASPIAMSTSFGARVGTIEPGDEDYFSVRVRGGEQLFLALQSQSDLVVEVQGNDGATRLLTVDSASTGSSADPPGEAANLTLPGPGRYVVQVRHAVPGERGFYVLLVILRPFTEGGGDFDGDFRVDPAVYSPAGIWTIFPSTTWLTPHPSIELAWGDPARGDIPVPADYDGDGRSDVAVYGGPTGEWRLRGAKGEETIVQWGNGMVGDLPVPGDYDGDRRCDLAVYRRTAGDWFIRFAAGGAATVRWGAPWLDDVPVPADYDGDGATDVAVYRNATGEWFVAYSSGGLGYTGWGAPWLGDIPVPGDYDGDSIADVAVYRRSTGGWFIRRASGDETWYSWGGGSDMPVPGDYDGDGVTDVAIYRGPPDVFLVRTSYTVSLMARPITGSGNVPVNLSTAVRLLAMP